MTTMSRVHCETALHRHPLDPLHRRILAGQRADARTRRRAQAMIAALPGWIERGATRDTDPEVRRIDDLVGQAMALAKRVWP